MDEERLVRSLRDDGNNIVGRECWLEAIALPPASPELEQELARLAPGHKQQFLDFWNAGHRDS